MISHVFWTQDQGGGVALLLNVAKKRFPSLICPYVDMLANLCTAQEIADYVSLRLNIGGGEMIQEGCSSNGHILILIILNLNHYDYLHIDYL